MEINVHNYEAFLLDELEGKLSAGQSSALRVFLLAHPELDVDLSGSDFPALAPEPIAFPTPSSLAKDKPSELEIKVISYLEGQMDSETRLVFEKETSGNKHLQ